MCVSGRQVWTPEGWAVYCFVQRTVNALRNVNSQACVPQYVRSEVGIRPVC